jgi:hypothetical protein
LFLNALANLGINFHDVIHQPLRENGMRLASTVFAGLTVTILILPISKDLNKPAMGIFIRSGYGTLVLCGATLFMFAMPFSI